MSSGDLELLSPDPGGLGPGQRTALARDLPYRPPLGRFP
jgi:hypothetical protein